jgi:hypothetical protein
VAWFAGRFLKMIALSALAISFAISPGAMPQADLNFAFGAEEGAVPWGERMTRESRE